MDIRSNQSIDPWTLGTESTLSVHQVSIIDGLPLSLTVFHCLLRSSTVSYGLPLSFTSRASLSIVGDSLSLVSLTAYLVTAVADY